MRRSRHRRAASSISSLLLAFVVGFFLWGRRRSSGGGCATSLVWALIFAMVVIAYGFRDVLRERAAAGGDGAARRGHDRAPPRLATGISTRRSRSTAAPVRFMVDTGASDIVLSRRDAERVGLDPDALAYLGRAMTANGAVATAAVRLGLVKLGDFTDTERAGERHARAGSTPRSSG